MKKISSMIALLMVACLLVCGCQAQPAPEPAPAAPAASAAPEGPSQSEAPAAPVSPYDQADVITLGGVWYLTGASAGSGQYAREGGLLAIKQINEAGGLLGKEVVLVEEDEGEGQQASVNAVMKLLSRGNISAFFANLISTNVVACSSIVREYKVPHLNGGASVSVIEDGNPYQWMPRQTDDQSKVWYPKVIVEKFNCKRVAIIHKTDTYGQGLCDAAVAGLKELYGLDVVGTFAYNTGEKNFAPIMTQIAAKEPDCLLSFGDTTEAVLIMNQVAEMKLDMVCIGTSSHSTALCLKNAGEAANGWYACSDWSIAVPSDAAKKFVADYNAEFGRDPDFISAEVYDSFMLIAEAIKAAGSADPEAINEQLGKITNYEGVMSTMTANEHHSFAVSRYLTQNVDGAAVIIEAIDR